MKMELTKLEKLLIIGALKKSMLDEYGNEDIDFHYIDNVKDLIKRLNILL